MSGAGAAPRAEAVPIPRRPAAHAREAAAVLLVLAVAAAPHWRALMGGLSYYFRDFSVTFYPLRLFQARELAQGRLPFWNPYINQGSFVLPAFYPPDLLHALWPGPAAVSWLLTLHLPLAGAAAYAFAREMGARRWGAVVGGGVYALGGLAASSLNLYVFLQALAWAPAVAAAAHRAARAASGRWVAALALAIGVSLSTMAVEFVAQSVVLGLALAFAAAPARRTALGAVAGLLLGIGLAAVPVAVTAGFLGETVRGGGFDSTVALANELHPVALLQAVVPDLFGSLEAPVEAWWGGRFFTKGFPYFLSIYTGVVALALAAVGWRRLPPRERRAMGAVVFLGVWYALGERGGLAPLLHSVPALRWFRFPSKALLLAYLALVPCVALGFDRLRAGDGWRSASRSLIVVAGIAAVPALAVGLRPATVAAWAVQTQWALDRVAATSAAAAAVGAAAAVLAWAAGRGLLRAPVAAALLAAVGLADLARAHAGLNPLVSPRFYEPLPEMAALRLDRGGRAFSYGPDESPAFRRLLAAAPPGLALWSFFLNRQLQGPYNNILDAVESPEAKDLTSFVPPPPLFTREDYDPAAVGGVVTRLRHAAVGHVLSLDPLAHTALRERAAVPTGVEGLAIHVYELKGALPRVYVACRTVAAPSRDAALSLPFRPEFDTSRDVALEAAGVTAACRAGSARAVPTGRPDAEVYEVEADGAAVVVTRGRFAHGWRATVDGHAAAVTRANGLHRAVPVPGGRHEVRLWYQPPGLRYGMAFMAASVIALLGVLIWPRIL